MEMSMLEEDGCVTISLEGRLDTITAPELTEAIKEVEFTALTVNMERLEYISSAGLRALLICKKAADSQGAGMMVVKPCAAVLDVIRVSGFNKILKIGEE